VDYRLRPPAIDIRRERNVIEVVLVEKWIVVIAVGNQKSKPMHGELRLSRGNEIVDGNPEFPGIAVPAAWSPVILPPSAVPVIPMIW
jgi:hypothetical protein